MELIVKDAKTGEKLLTRKNVPYDLMSLLTKRFNKNAKYSKEGAGMYKQIVKLAQIPLERTGGSLKQHILIARKPSDVVKRFESVVRHIDSGGNNRELKKEVSILTDYLLNERMISPDESKYIHYKYVL